MNYKLLSLSFLCCLAAVRAAAQVPAFPGAEGHGRYVTGGRGGRIVHVTNLNDSGNGSFRQAVSGSDKKIVIFDVGGVIALNSDVTIGANTTIMGQTAPKPGITLRYYTVQFGGDNIIVRFLRSRRGQERNVNDGADAIWTRNKTGIMLDHCSFSWSIDEVASFYDNNNFTMQWCTIGESLVHAGHNKGPHGYGGIWGGKLASFHHNLICHVANRSPRFNGARYNWAGYTGNLLYTDYKWENAVQAENVDFRNCVVYNCGNGCYGGPGGGQINMVNNFYKTGPAATTSRLTTVSVGSSGNASGYPIFWGMTSRYYISGNQIDDTHNADWGAVAYDDGVKTHNGQRYSADPTHYYGSAAGHVNIGGTDCMPIRLTEPAPAGVVTTHTAEEAFGKVLEYAGASHIRDDVDTRYALEAENGTATYKGSATSYVVEKDGKVNTYTCTPTWGRIDLVSDVEGYTENNFGTGRRPNGYDADGDGMPDDWESENGLDPSDPSDASLYTIDPARHYTNVEVYCNSVVQRIMLGGNADAQDGVDDYYPAYYNTMGMLVEAINMPEIVETEDITINLSQSTNVGGNTSSTYCFNDGVTITNTRGKSYATGNNGGIKYSAGVQYTIQLPSDIAVSNITFAGYDNYTDANAYLGEVNGTQYASTDYVFPSTKATVVHSIDLPDATGSITFTPQGKQVVLSIALKGKRKGLSGIASQPAPGAAGRTVYYNMQGQRTDRPAHGVFVKTVVGADGVRRSHTVIMK